MYQTLYFDILIATLETMYMVFLSTVIAGAVGIPLGTLLFTTRTLRPNRALYKILDGLVNITRSIPFIILLVAIIPITRWVVGTSIGLHAAILPLTVGAIPFVARIIDTSYQNLPKGLLDASASMGATTWQITRYVLLPESKAAFIHALTLTSITLVNYSAMAGTVGGGGLGDLAIRYGYQRFNVQVMLITVMVLVIIVQLLQYIGDKLAKYLQPHKQHNGNNR